MNTHRANTLTKSSGISMRHNLTLRLLWLFATLALTALAPATAVAQIDLGSQNGINLNLILPVTINAGAANEKTYYHLDDDEDGSADSGDTLSHNMLNTLLNGGSGTTDTQTTGNGHDGSDDARSVIIGRHALILPTTAEMRALGSAQGTRQPSGWRAHPSHYWTSTPAATAGWFNAFRFEDTDVFPRSSGGNFATAFQVIVLPLAVPAAPTGVTAIGAGAGFTVNWISVPDAGNGGSDITGYTATATNINDGTDTANCTAAATATTCDITTGLTNGATYRIAVVATNAQGNSASSTPPVELSAGVGLPAITDQTYDVGQDVTFTLPEPISGASPFTYTLTPAANIPDGLVFTPADRTLAGAPNAAAVATALTYTVTDSAGNTASQTFSVTITEPLLFDGTIANQSYVVDQTVALTLPEATGGIGSYTYSLVRRNANGSLNTTTLPPGLSFVAADRAIRGASTVVFAVSTPARLVYTVTDSAATPGTADLTFTMQVNAAPVVSLELDSATINESGTGNSTTVTASLNTASAAETVVTITAPNGANANDYSLSPNTTLTIAAGNTTSTGTVTITATDNNVDAPNKESMVSATATNAAAVTGPADVTLTIVDDDAPATATLAYSGTFTEAAANDGSVDGSITATLTGDTFATDVITGNHVSVTANLPAGLTAAFARTSDTMVTLTLTGTATSHANANDVNDLTITFAAAAFTSGTAATGSTYTTGMIDFRDAPAAATLAYSGTFTEAAANDGSVDGSIIATLTGDTFATDVITGNHVSVTANLPAGLTAAFARTSNTVVTLTLTGAATSHANANDVTDLTITFAAAAFAAGTAATDSTYTTGMIDFRDAPAPATLAYTGTFTEAAANDGSVDGSIIATLTGDTFATDVITGNHVSVTANLPAGLTAAFARTSDTMVTLTLTGTATSHANANDVNDLTITFAAAAFTSGTAATGSTYTTGMIDFRDAPAAVNFGDATIDNLTYTFTQTDTTVTTQAVNLTLPVANGGVGTLIYTLMPNPSDLVFNANTNPPTLTGTPDMVETRILTYTVTDSANPPQTASLTFSVVGVFQKTVSPTATVVSLDRDSDNTDAPETGMLTLPANHMVTTVTLSDPPQNATDNPPAGIEFVALTIIDIDIEGTLSSDATATVCLPTTGVPDGREPAIYHSPDLGTTWNKTVSAPAPSDDFVCGMTNTFSLFGVGHVAKATAVNLHEQILSRVSQTVTAGTLAAVGARVDAAARAAGAGVSANAAAPTLAYQLGGQSSMRDLLQAHGKSMLEGEMEVEQLLDGASFVIPLSAAGDQSAGHAFGALSVWGGIDYRNLSSDEGGLDWDGGVSSFHFGIDGLVGDTVLAGVALSGHRADFDYESTVVLATGTGEYQYHSTNINPYLGWFPSKNVKLWASAGFGSGEVVLDEVMNEMETGGKYVTDTSQSSFTGGFSARLLRANSLTLYIKGDATQSKVKLDEAERIMQQEVNSHRTRLLLSGEQQLKLASGGAMTPSLEVGARSDGGDGVTGSGMEFGTGLHYTNPDGNLVVSGNVRTLLAHDYDEWGADLNVRILPPSGRGLSLSVNPVWGKAQSAAERLWNDGANGVGDSGDGELQSSLAAEVGYGVAATMLGAPGLMTPYLGMSTDEVGIGRVRLGGRFAGGNGLSLNLEGAQGNTVDGVNHTVLLRGELAF